VKNPFRTNRSRLSETYKRARVQSVALSALHIVITHGHPELYPSIVSERVESCRARKEPKESSCPT